MDGVGIFGKAERLKWANFFSTLWFVVVVLVVVQILCMTENERNINLVAPSCSRFTGIHTYMYTYRYTGQDKYEQ